jgi:hypothetical protein
LSATGIAGTTHLISASLYGIAGMDVYNAQDLTATSFANLAGTSRFTSRILDLTPPIVIPKPGAGQPSIHAGSHPVRGQSVPVKGSSRRVPGKADRI